MISNCMHLNYSTIAILPCALSAPAVGSLYSYSGLDYWNELLDWITELTFSDLKFSLNMGNLAVIYCVAMGRIVHVCVSN